LVGFALNESLCVCSTLSFNNADYQPRGSIHNCKKWVAARKDEQFIQINKDKMWYLVVFSAGAIFGYFICAIMIASSKK